MSNKLDLNRNLKIAIRVVSGETMKSVGSDYSISIGRVKQITKNTLLKMASHYPNIYVWEEILFMRKKDWVELGDVFKESLLKMKDEIS